MLNKFSKFTALKVLGIVIFSIILLSWKGKGQKEFRDSAVHVQVFNSTNPDAVQAQMEKFITDNKITREKIVSVNNSGVFVPGQGIYFTFFLTYDDGK